MSSPAESPARPPIPSGRPLSVMHILRTDDRNRLLNALVDSSGPEEVRWSVVAVEGPGPMAEDMRARGVRHEALGYQATMGRLPAMVRDVRRLITDTRPDIVHAHLFLPGLATALARAGLRASPRFVLSRHHNRSHHSAHRPVHAWLDGWTARRADRVIAVSDAVGQTLVSLERVPANRVAVVYNGLDPSRLAVDPAVTAEWSARFGTGPLAVAAGRIDPEKDYPTLIRAVALARRKHPTLQLAVAGTGPEREVRALEQLAAAVGAGSPAFLGWVADVFALMMAADVFVQSSRDEACPQSILEAQALSVPLAVTTPGGVRDVIAAEHPDVPPGDAEALAQRITAVLDDLPGARRQAHDWAQHVCDSFSAARMCAGHLEVYRHVRRAVG